MLDDKISALGDFLEFGVLIEGHWLKEMNKVDTHQHSLLVPQWDYDPQRTTEGAVIKIKAKTKAWIKTL